MSQGLAGAASRVEQGAFDGGDGALGIVIAHLYY